LEEEDATFSDYLRLLPTCPANNPSPKLKKQRKSSLSENAFARLLLLRTIQNISR
jgi:hypothetical protein